MEAARERAASEPLLLFDSEFMKFLYLSCNLLAGYGV